MTETPKRFFELAPLVSPHRRRCVASLLGLVVGCALIYGCNSAQPDRCAEFTIIALPDTQKYSEHHPEGFITQTQWIKEQRDARNIVFVTHLGDIVQDADEIEQWERARKAMAILEGPQGVPYGLCVGNHDQDPSNDPDGTEMYNRFFPYSLFEDKPWYGGHFGNDNDNSYQLFEAAGMKMIIVHIEFDLHPRQEVLDWANAVLSEHRDRRAIVSSHFILSKKEPNAFAEPGQILYDGLKHNDNLFLMLCGHCSHMKEARRSDEFEGRTIHTLLADYQRRPRGGNGWLRIHTFVPAANEIRVETYSPVLDKYEIDEDSQFVLFYDMASRD